jgi:hypothetical protein
MNPIASCLACGQTDDHPKHSVAITPVNYVDWHYDCHHAVTGCEICAPIVKSAKGKTGEELRAHLMGKKG